MADGDRIDLVIIHASELVTCAGDDPGEIGVVLDGAIAIAGERIVQVGTTADLLAAIDLADTEVIDATGLVVMPGFVDAHTHVVFGGSRIDEYVARTSAGDLDAVRASGAPVGIRGTVATTRARSIDDLVDETLSRLQDMLAAGTTTAESKSGYGLTVESELRLLEVNHRLDALQPIDIVSTFLGAHGVPDGVTREDYIDQVTTGMLPRVAASGLAEFHDVWCDVGQFSVAESTRMLKAGLALGLRPKLHLDQLGHIGGAELAARTDCVSVDHLNHTTDAEMRLMAEAGVTAVAMPGIDFATAQVPPVDCRRILASGMRLALATDICPGGWIPSMQFVIALTCRLHGLTPAEAIRAATLGGAHALARGDQIGALAVGRLADVLVLDVSRHEDLAYRIGRNAVTTVVKRGRVVLGA